MSANTTLPLLALFAAWPFLPAAGCTAHHAASITADVSGTAGPVAVLYAHHGDEPRRWAPLRDCDVAAEDSPRDGVRIRGCTSYIGVNYEIDIIAVEDANDNGALDAGERYGVWAGGPLRRDREEAVGAIRIAIDRTLAEGEPAP